jgi:hypothetical protein
LKESDEDYPSFRFESQVMDSEANATTEIELAGMRIAANIGVSQP